MISPNERKKIGFPLLSQNAEMKKYVEVYSLFAESGYSKELCQAYSDAFLDNVKKPSPFDIVQISALYDRIHDHKTAYFYLEKLVNKRLSGDERFFFCTQVLNTLSKIGNWREAENFRTNNISFLQKYSEKATQNMQARLYMAQVLEETEDVDGALTIYESYAKEHKKDGEAQYNLVKLLMENENYETALSYIEQAKKVVTGEQKKSILEYEVIATEKQGDLEGAKALLEEYLSLYPKDQRAAKELVFLKSCLTKKES